MNAVEREELHDAMERIERRFELRDEMDTRFRDEMRREVSAINGRLGRIEAMARLAAWSVTAISGIATIAGALLFLANRGGLP